MTAPLPLLPRSTWRRTKDAVHAAQFALGRAWGRPGTGMKTDLQIDGRPVIFIHNPKTGGTSLGEFLHVGHLSHRFPRERLSPASWQNCFSIVVVRDPFERFLSCYYANVLRPGDGGLTKRYGPAVKTLTPSEFLALLADNPAYGGPQVNWTDYPLAVKPRADLILRFEDAASWKDKLVAAGLAVADRTMMMRNVSERSASDHLTRLQMDESEFAKLNREVLDFFDEDCRAFGYGIAA